jgi:hypothetical protein
MSGMPGTSACSSSSTSSSASAARRPLCLSGQPGGAEVLRRPVVLQRPLGSTLVLPRPLGSSVVLRRPLGSALVLPQPLGSTVVLGSLSSAPAAASLDPVGPPRLSEGFRRIRVVRGDESTAASSISFPCIAATDSVQESVDKDSSSNGQTLRALYLFAGDRRKADVSWYLRKLCLQHKVKLVFLEFDLGKGNSANMKVAWDKIRGKIEDKEFELVFCTPPGGEFSRTKWTSKKGAQPSRSRQHPLGYPWLKGGPKRLADQANLLVERALEACQIAHLAGARFLCAHAEDLGRAASGEPASLWQLPITRQLAEDTSADTVVFFQCRWQKCCQRSPTRLMGTVSNLRSMGHAGWPSFTKQGHYAGPLPRRCGHSHSEHLVSKQAGTMRAAATAAYPPQFCSALALLFMEDFLLHSTVKRATATLTPSGGEQLQESGHKKQVHLKSALQVEAEDAESDLDEDGFPKPKFGAGLWGQGPPLSYVESGKRKLFADGCGLCSPGRWEPERRQVVGSTLADEVRSGLLKVLREKLNVKKVLFQLACNQFTTSPFGEALLVEGIETFVSLLKKHGAAGASDEVPPGQPVRLPALESFLLLCGDPDSRVFHSSSRSFSKGVTLGILGKLPRVPSVFDRKERWRKYPEEEGEPEDGDNYVSARDHLDSIKKQFEEEQLWVL